MLKRLLPGAIMLVILFFGWLILVNLRRLRKIRNSGRISEIIDRRRNIIFFTIVITVLVLGLLVNLYI